ncbi:MAG TPA: heavy metal translocating P-type ATPase metal-binding domain-containing protein [Gemmatimonadales bacterium]|nr:heavy metal translocating P-type ATPase metal-binding domain-containing protein [Gemmatimonadales bacterium]
MAERIGVIGHACTHCGLAMPDAVPVGTGPTFCCAGCEGAHAILLAGGLDRYYRLAQQRTRRVDVTGRSYEEFDHSAFHELYVITEPGDHARTELYLEGVHCASCVWLVERIPILEPGIVRAELDMRRSRLMVEWDPGQVPLARIARLLDRLGYAPHPFRGVARESMRRREDRRALVRIGIAGALAGNVMLLSFALYAGDFLGMAGEHAQLFRWLAFLLTVPALLIPGRIFLAGAWAALRSGTLHMDLPIAVALLAATIRGGINTVSDSGPIYFDGVAILIFLLLVGRWLQQRGQRAATDTAEMLLALAPQVAMVVGDEGEERELPVSALLPGMAIRVRAGGVIPADGAIVTGTSSVDTSLLTGESLPVEVGPGDAVAAGMHNIAGPLTVRVDAAGSASRLARLLGEVEASAARRAPVVLLANRLSGVFVAVVLLLAAVTFLLWVGRDPHAAFDHAIALLVVTCPCALALATPLAVSVAVGRAAQAGILIKGGDILETLARPGLLVLDKTGTLTTGCHELVHWRGDARWQGAILALEHGSIHPVAAGFRRAWPATALPRVTEVTHHHGGGITGRLAGQRLVLGSPEFVLGHASDPDHLAASLMSLPWTPALLAAEGRVVAVAGFGDPIRSDSAGALARLREAGWTTQLLSGDVPRVAERVGRELGFAAHEIQGGVTPEGKLATIERLRHAEAGRAVVMVGDGVNDAAAIAAADVGIGVHGGAEVSLATADVHLTLPGVQPLVTLMGGAALTFRVIRRNMAWAILYNLIGVTLAMTGLLSPLVAALMMPASSLTVLLSSWWGNHFGVPRRRDSTPEAAVMPWARAA